MDIRGSRILLLGGSGLVGTAVARQLFRFSPSLLVISALTRREAEGAVAELRDEASAADVALEAVWGDIFVPHAFKDMRRGEILADPAARTTLLDDLYGAFGEDSVERSALGALLLEHRPEIVVDSINTATVFAYQNIFSSVAAMRERVAQGTADAESIESMLATMYLPQLIQHARIALDAMRRVGTRMYIKIGTAGTGGMGLNIPFTHSEDRPSRILLAKSSVAGAHTLLLYLMARTPGAPAVKEIKPTAAISWKRIGSGEILRRGRTIPRVDALRPLPLDAAFPSNGQPPAAARDTAAYRGAAAAKDTAPAKGMAEAAEPAWRDTGEPLQGVYVDAGENGFFSPPEFEALSALGLMEFITPEEIAQDVVREIQGYPTGHDVVAALDASTSGPTYRAGVLREAALRRMEALEEQLGSECVAYEMLGPPRLSKLLFEAAILRRLADDDLGKAASLDCAAAAQDAERLIREDAELRIRILSIGLPILLPDGMELLRGADVKVAPGDDGTTDTDRLAERGWVDLRPANWEHWRRRAVEILHRIETMPGVDLGSRTDVETWHDSRRIRPGALAAWVFRYEDGGERIRR